MVDSSQEEKNKIFVHPPHGFVRLDGMMGGDGDLSVVNAARVSFAKRADTLGDAEVGLINYLMKNRHGTPFEHNAFRFNIRCPLFVAREWFRHRWSSFNEESLRYSGARLEGYIPAPEDFRKQVGKPGAYYFEPVDDFLAEDAKYSIEDIYDMAFSTYQYLINKGLAKEQARMVLPVGIYTEFYWTVNARGLMNFLSLRNEHQAQKEIRDYAQAVEVLWSRVMPETQRAFENNGRIAP